MLIPQVSSRVKQEIMNQQLANQPLQIRPVMPEPDPVIIDEQKVMQGQNLVDSINPEGQVAEMGPAEAETGNEGNILSFIGKTLGTMFGGPLGGALAESFTESMTNESGLNDIMDFVAKTSGVDPKGLPRATTEEENQMKGGSLLRGLFSK